MRRTGLMVLIGALMATAVLATPASAKGERGTVRILIPPDDVIVLRHEDAAEYGGDSGLFEAKWDDPNLGGTLSPSAYLGTGFKVLVRFGPECRGDVVHQVLYPYVEGGPQVFTPPGEVMCGGPVPDGYFPAPADLLHRLITAGLPPAAMVPTATVSPVAEARAAGGGGGSGGFGPGGWLALGFLVTIGGAVAILIRAERRTTVAG